MASHEYATYRIFLLTRLLDFNILKNYDGRIETPWPKLFSSNHCIRQNDARHELETGPNSLTQILQTSFLSFEEQSWARNASE